MHSNQNPNRRKEYQALTDQSYLLKFDLFNFVTKFDEKDIASEIHLGFEKKLAKTSFSINFETVFAPFGLKNNEILRGGNDITNSKGNRFGLTLEPRWYYDMNKRRVKNESGNNLLGNYLSFEFLYQNFSVNKYRNNGQATQFSSESLSFTPLFGVQQQYSKRIFYDFKLGWGVKTPKDVTNAYFKKYESNIYADILVGWCFSR